MDEKKSERLRCVYAGILKGKAVARIDVYNGWYIGFEPSVFAQYNFQKGDEFFWIPPRGRLSTPEDIVPIHLKKNKKEAVEEKRGEETGVLEEAATE